MEKKSELITNEIKSFPEFENIRNAIIIKKKIKSVDKRKIKCRI